jgi:hypothetical protein
LIVQRFKRQFFKEKHKNSQKNSVNNGKRYGSLCFNKLGLKNDFMHETLKFYDTVRYALSEKLALKTLNLLIKYGVFRCLPLFLE